MVSHTRSKDNYGKVQNIFVMEKVYKCKTLLGHKNLEFSIACLGSFIDKSMDRIELQIFDDGTVTDADEDKLRSGLDNISVIRKHARDSTVNEKLKPFSNCLKYRNSSPYAQKLFDVMLFDESDLFFIDSDVYFVRKFRLPEFGVLPVFMRDEQNAYSFTPSEFLNIPFAIFGRVNTGLFLFPLKFYDLNFLEVLLSDSLVQRGFNRTWLEQTLWAFLAGRIPAAQYFDSEQIKLSRRHLSIDDNTIAVHLISTFRYQFEYLKSLDLPEQELFRKIRLLNSTTILNKYEFAADRIRKGIYRRMGVFQ